MWALPGGRGAESAGGKGEVKETALVRGHGLEQEGAAGLKDAGDGAASLGAEGLVALLAVVAGVDGEKVVLVGLQAANLKGEVLDGAEDLGVAGGEDGRVGARDGGDEVRNGAGVGFDLAGEIQLSCIKNTMQQVAETVLGKFFHVAIPAHGFFFDGAGTWRMKWRVGAVTSQVCL